MIYGDNIYAYKETDSTNRELRLLVMQNGVPSGAVCIAEKQTAGRGRQSRSFFSPEGLGIYMSAYIETKTDVSEVASVSAMASVAVCRAIEETTGKTVGIKWINDIYFNGKKAVGILCETVSYAGTNTLKGVIIGVGVNCFEPEGGYPPEIRGRAAALGLKNSAEMDALSLSLVLRLRELGSYTDGDWLPFYRSHSVVLGRAVEVFPGGARPFRGVAQEIDRSGALIVRAESGEYVTLNSGEISLRLT